MKRVALIFTSGTLAFGMMLSGFYIAGLILTATVQFHHPVYKVMWLK